MGDSPMTKFGVQRSEAKGCAIALTEPTRGSPLTYLETTAVNRLGRRARFVAARYDSGQHDRHTLRKRERP